MTHRVLFAETSQTLRHVPVDRFGRVVRVTSATYTLVDLRESEDSPERELGDGAATLGSVDTLLTTTAGASEADPTLVPVTSAAGVSAGHTYLLIAADGRRESFRVRRVDGTNVYATHELAGDYTTTARVQDVELAAAFPDDEAASESALESGAGPYQVTWDYAIEDRPYLVPETVWLTRYSVQPFITEGDVLIAYPTLGMLARRRITIADGIAAATQDYVAEAESAGKDPTLYRATHIAKVAVRERVIEYVLRWCGKFDEATTHEQAWSRYVNQMFVGVPKGGAVTVSRTENTAVAGGDRRQQNRFVRRS